MELFGLLIAAPVTLVTSIIYVCIVLAVYRFLPVVGRVLVVGSIVLMALLAIELVILAAMGARGAYAHLGHAFTAIHFLSFFLGPPAVANLVFYFVSRRSAKKWVRFFSAALCCWISCMVALVGHIAVDEAVVGIDAGRPFYMTPPGPNKTASPNRRPRFAFDVFREFDYFFLRSTVAVATEGESHR